MAATISLVVSFVSLCVSGFTAWLTLLRRGKILMTQPTVIYFGPDGGSYYAHAWQLPKNEMSEFIREFGNVLQRTI